MTQQKFFTTGEFAEFCRTTKETLFHYDRQGILKPRHVSENGYRRYAVEQFFVFDLIRVLKEAGSSLKEIKRYLNSYDEHSLLVFLEQRVDRIEEERRQLTMRRDALTHIAEVTRSAIAADYGKLSIDTVAGEHLIVTPTNPEKNWSWSFTATALREHFIHCEALGIATVFPLGTIIQPAYMRKGTFMESGYFSTVPACVASERYMRKPGGSYATLVHRGSYDDLLTLLPELLESIRLRGFAVTGNAYVYDLLSYLASENEHNDVHKVMIQVEEI